jgi:hypothetical protein
MSVSADADADADAENDAAPPRIDRILEFTGDLRAIARR